MSVLLVAEVLAGQLNKDSTAKALTAAAQLGDVDVLCASGGCGHRIPFVCAGALSLTA